MMPVMRVGIAFALAIRVVKMSRHEIVLAEGVQVMLVMRRLALCLQWQGILKVTGGTAILGCACINMHPKNAGDAKWHCWGCRLALLPPHASSK